MKPSKALLPLTLFFLLSANTFAKEEYSIGVEKAAIKSRPSFLGSTKFKLKYGDPILILKEQGEWVQVRAMGKDGWCHRSAIGERDSILKDIGKGDKVAASSTSDEVTLAGKGFTETHEDYYKKKNPKADFKDVDKMESYEISSNTLNSFIAEGGLNEN